MLVLAPDEVKGTNRAVHKAFAFLVKDCLDTIDHYLLEDNNISLFCENIEKLIMLRQAGVEIPVDCRFRVTEVGIIQVVPIHIIREIITLKDLDTEIEKILEAKDIYFISRMPWKIEKREIWMENDVVLRAYRRFNFLVFDKEPQ